jgi:hypothetical protein
VVKLRCFASANVNERTVTADGIGWHWRNSIMLIDGGKIEVISKNLTISALFTRNSTWTTLTSNPGLRGDLRNTLINCKRCEIVSVLVMKTF